MNPAVYIWAALGLCFEGLGVYCFFAKKSCNFWANAKVFEVENVRGYNLAVGILWCLYGAVLTLCGLPLLYTETRPALFLISIFGTVAASIAMMVVYTTVIEKKFRKK